MLGEENGSELTYSTSPELTWPPDGLQPEAASLKRRTDAVFDFCVFFVSPAVALICVLNKVQTQPFSLAFITQVIVSWLVSLVLPLMAGFFAGANRQYLNKRVFLIVWAHLTAALLYRALS
jgi:hypothetical protein